MQAYTLRKAIEVPSALCFLTQCYLQFSGAVHQKLCIVHQVVDYLTTGQHTRVGNVFMYATEQHSNNFKLEDASNWLRQGEHVGKHDKLSFCIPASPAKATHILQPYLQMGVGIRTLLLAISQVPRRILTGKKKIQMRTFF